MTDHRRAAESWLNCAAHGDRWADAEWGTTGRPPKRARRILAALIGIGHALLALQQPPPVMRARWEVE